MAVYRIIKYEKVEEASVHSSTCNMWSVLETITTNSYVEIVDDTEDLQVCKKLKELKILPKNCTMRTVEFTDFNSDIIEVRKKKDKMPYCRLIRKKF